MQPHHAPPTSPRPPLPHHPLHVLLTQILQDSRNSPFRIRSISDHMAHDHLDGDALVGAMPAVVVGAHADEGVCDFGFAEEFAFGDGGHVDYGDGGLGGEGAVEEGFGAG